MPPQKGSWAKPKSPTLSPAKSDEAKKKLGIVNPYSRTWGPTKIAVGMASSGIKKA